MTELWEVVLDNHIILILGVGIIILIYDVYHEYFARKEVPDNWLEVHIFRTLSLKYRKRHPEYVGQPINLSQDQFRISVDKDWSVRKAIAENPNLDPKYHEKLANDENGPVQGAITQNSNLNPKYHEKLVNDKDWPVREAIAEKPNLDPKHHEKLVNDEKYMNKNITG